MRTRLFTYLFLTVLILAIAPATFAQALDISSGGLPTITGAVNGSVTGSANVTNDLVVTINFGEVSPLNPNAVVKVVVPIALRSNQPYQVAVSVSGLANPNSEGLQASDVGFGLQNLRLLGGAGQICNQSTHIIRSPFNNDPANVATVGPNGRVSYQSSLGDGENHGAVLAHFIQWRIKNRGRAILAPDRHDTQCRVEAERVAERLGDSRDRKKQPAAT